VVGGSELNERASEVREWKREGVVDLWEMNWPPNRESGAYIKAGPIYTRVFDGLSGVLFRRVIHHLGCALSSLLRLPRLPRLPRSS
jgi:hypothetical protein